MGVRNKPDLLTDWDHMYNLRNQSVLRKDCRLLIEKLENKAQITIPQLESLITLYCKKRSVEYNKEFGWMEIMEKLIVLPFEQFTLFNIFYAITTKYVPKLVDNLNINLILILSLDPQKFMICFVYYCR